MPRFGSGGEQTLLGLSVLEVRLRSARVCRGEAWWMCVDG